MAKMTRTTSFKNATISRSDMTITEISKDEEKVYSLNKLIDDWNGVEGISISIKQDNDLPEDGEGSD